LFRTAAQNLIMYLYNHNTLQLLL